LYKDIILQCGNILSKVIDKPAVACRGIIRLSIYDSGLRERMNQGLINFKDMMHVVRNALRRRLERLFIRDLDNVIDNIEQELIENQSIFTFSL
jgi:hypothetical protein